MAAREHFALASNDKSPPRSPPGRGRRQGDSKTLDLFSSSGRAEPAALHEIAQTRYLNYALSVITARALPDVRDGMKPVQRRILYTMYQQRLTADSRHRKCAKVVGDVMGNFHPHGDSAIYDALVRIAQPFSMRVPLVDGAGNFGSLDGDPAAAMRYTECRLGRIAHTLLDELDADTVTFRPNYDGTRDEPVVLPARFPHLLVNGSSGIAVGMATSIPPHNLEEVCQASIRLLDALLEGRQLSSRELCRTIKGPDFPTGGQIISTIEELKQIYETGQGTIKIRGTWEPGTESRNGRTLFVTSIPYNIQKSSLVERIAEVVTSRSMPHILDVRDVSTDDVRIELLVKKDADDELVMAYLFKHTPLQSNFSVNLTCLVPTENPEVGRPERLDLQSILWHFLHFRLEVVTRRLEHELRQLTVRMHVLEGFVTVFDALDQILGIIRKSEGKQDAANKIMARFSLDAEQTDAILELRLYRLARLEILVIQKELAEKKRRAKEIRRLLEEKDQKGRWGIVRAEIEETSSLYGKSDRRRTTVASIDGEREISAEELIVAEDNHVLLTRDGWVKRQKEIRDPASTRLREGDAVLACMLGSTRATLVFFSNLGTTYTCRFVDIPATTGYGEPIQKLFRLRDGEAIIAAFSLDPRVIGEIAESEKHLPPTYALAATSDGLALSFALTPFAEPSTRTGRRFAKLSEGANVITVALTSGTEDVLFVTEERRVLVTSSEQINYLSGPGKGVCAIALSKTDRLLGMRVITDDKRPIVVRTEQDTEQKLVISKFRAMERGGRGVEFMKRVKIARIVDPPIEAPALPEP